MKVSTLATALAFCLTALASPLEGRATKCNTANVNAIENNENSPVAFCYSYLASTKKTSPITSLTPAAVSSACACITSSATACTATSTKYRTKTETDTLITTKTKTKTQTVTVTTTYKATTTVVNTKVKTTVSTSPPTTVTLKASCSKVSPVLSCPLSTITTISVSTVVPAQRTVTSISRVTVIASAASQSVPQNIVTSVSYVTISGSASVKQQTVKLTVQPPTVTISGSGTTLTAYSTIEGPTITAISTLTLSSSGICPSGNSSAVSTPMVFDPCDITTMIAPTDASTIASSTTVSSSDESTTKSGDNVPTCTSTSSSTYYIQVDGTGLDIDGTVMIGPTDTNNGGVYQGSFSRPQEIDSHFEPQSVTYSSDTLALSNSDGNTLQVYVYEDDRPGSIWFFPNAFYSGRSLLCNVTGSDRTLECGATVEDVWYSGLQVTGSKDEGYSPYLSGANTAEPGIDATFRLIGACSPDSATATSNTTAAS